MFMICSYCGNCKRGLFGCLKLNPQIRQPKKVDPEIADDAQDQQISPSSVEESSIVGTFTIAEAKRRLAEAFGVSPDQIDITVRG